jgi:Mn2+/Fe2+ NRAMP family transporter
MLRTIGHGRRHLALPRLRLRVRRAGIFAYIAALGPGLIAANAGNDAGGIATYASLGSAYGYQLLWVLLLAAIALAIVQEMAARVGAVTGKGFSELIREQFGVRWALFVILALLVANAGIAASEFIGLGAAAELLGISRYLAVPIAGVALWVIIVLGTYTGVERVLLVMTLAFLAYPISAVIAHPDWGAVARGIIVPSAPINSQAIEIIIATVGTTISPYLPLYLQSSVVEKGVEPRDLKLQRVDVFGGQAATAIIAFAIVIATAATLFHEGVRVEDAADAARALEPVAGRTAEALFAIGLFGACMLAGAVLPVTTAYSITEALGFEKGISRSFHEAPVFISLFTGILIFSVLFALIPGLPVISVIIFLQVVNGLVLPIVLIALIRLANDDELMGRYKNGIAFNVIAWSAVVAAIVLSLVLVGLTVLEWVGIA